MTMNWARQTTTRRAFEVLRRRLRRFKVASMGV
jgi:hypothetical protein